MTFLTTYLISHYFCHFCWYIVQIITVLALLNYALPPCALYHHCTASHLTRGDVHSALLEGPLVAHAVPHDEEGVEAERRVDHQLCVGGAEDGGQPAGLAGVGQQEYHVVAERNRG